MSVLSPPVGSDDHLLGNPDAGVSLLEYGDYECPFCGQAQALVHAVLRRLGNRLTLAYRHFPMSNAHPHAMLAATAAEAAGLQGQFWEMHETLFQNQDALELDDLLGYARGLGLDLRRFASDMTGEACIGKVRRDFNSGIRSGVNGTPTFFIDGVRYDGPRDVDSMVEAIELARNGIQAVP